MSALEKILRDLRPVFNAADIQIIDSDTIRKTLLGKAANDDPPSSELNKNDRNAIKNTSDMLLEGTTLPIRYRFDLFKKISADLRVLCALNTFATLPRAGLMLRGYGRDQVESVLDHSKHLARMNVLAVTNFPALSAAFNEEAGNRNLSRDALITIMATKGYIHDLAEVLTTDLTPYDIETYLDGDKSKKVKIEDLAHRLLYQNEPVLAELMHQYEAKSGLEDKINKVNDIIEWLADCLIIQRENEPAENPIITPKEGFTGPFDEFIDESKRILTNDTLKSTFEIFGKKIINHMVDLHKNHDDKLKEFVASYKTPFECRQAFIDHIMGHKLNSNLPAPAYAPQVPAV